MVSWLCLCPCYCSIPSSLVLCTHFRMYNAWWHLKMFLQRHLAGISIVPPFSHLVLEYSPSVLEKSLLLLTSQHAHSLLCTLYLYGASTNFVITTPCSHRTFHFSLPIYLQLSIHADCNNLKMSHPSSGFSLLDTCFSILALPCLLGSSFDPYCQQ